MHMKEKRRPWPTLLVFILLFGLLFSLAETCFLHLFGRGIGLMTESGSLLEQFPRLAPLCWIAGGAGLLLTALTMVINVRKADPAGYATGHWILQWIGAFALSVPLTAVWDRLFRLLG